MREERKIVFDLNFRNYGDRLHNSGDMLGK